MTTLRAVYSRGFEWEEFDDDTYTALTLLPDLEDNSKLSAFIALTERDGQKFWTWRLTLHVKMKTPILLNYGVTQESLAYCKKLVDYIAASQSMSLLLLLASNAVSESFMEFLESHPKLEDGILMEAAR